MRRLLIAVGVVVGVLASKGAVDYKVVAVASGEESQAFLDATCYRGEGRSDREISLVIVPAPETTTIGDFVEFRVRVTKRAMSPDDIAKSYWNRAELLRDDRFTDRRIRVQLRSEEVDRAYIAIGFSNVREGGYSWITYCIPVPAIEEACRKSAPKLQP